jgi:hypothetical protein
MDLWFCITTNYRGPPEGLYWIHTKRNNQMPVDLISATAVAAGIITLSEMGDKEWTNQWIRVMYNDDDGSEVLRLIVKDDILGAADHIVDALWWCVFPTK